jgi:hypothetical protein
MDGSCGGQGYIQSAPPSVTVRVGVVQAKMECTDQQASIHPTRRFSGPRFRPATEQAASAAGCRLPAAPLEIYRSREKSNHQPEHRRRQRRQRRRQRRRRRRQQRGALNHRRGIPTTTRQPTQLLSAHSPSTHPLHTNSTGTIFNCPSNLC